MAKAIQSTHQALFEQAAKSVNVCLTLKNWLIGYRITEYEQNGHDRADYGANLMDHLSEALKVQGVPHCSPRRLYEYRLFYQSYPGILRSLPAESAESEIENVPRLPMASLLRSIYFTHFVELIKIDDLLKRSFYEIECVRGNCQLVN